MSTIEEIAEAMISRVAAIQTNSNFLNGINANTSQISQDTADLKVRVRDGFLNLSEGLFAILEVQRVANAHLESAVHQHDAMICWLGKMAVMMCEQLRELERQTALGQSLQTLVKVVVGILELAHPAEFVQYQRKLEIERRVMECCPAPAVEPEPCFEPCAPPTIIHHEPEGQDWRPLTPEEEPR